MNESIVIAQSNTSADAHINTVKNRAKNLKETGFSFEAARSIIAHEYESMLEGIKYSDRAAPIWSEYHERKM